MTDKVSIRASKFSLARKTGILYLLLAFFSGWPFIFRESLVIVGDATATATNIRANIRLFRFAFFMDLIGQVLFILTVLGFYHLFKEQNKTHATLLAVFGIVGVPIAMFNMVNIFAIVHLVENAVQLQSFSVTQVDDLILIFINLHGIGISIVSIFWGLWLLPLGILGYNSKNVPRVVGVFVFLGGTSYLVEFMVWSLFPDLASMAEYLVVVLSLLGEVSMMLWLLVKAKV